MGSRSWLGKCCCILRPTSQRGFITLVHRLRRVELKLFHFCEEVEVVLIAALTSRNLLNQWTYRAEGLSEGVRVELGAELLQVGDFLHRGRGTTLSNPALLLPVAKHRHDELVEVERCVLLCLKEASTFLTKTLALKGGEFAGRSHDDAS